jgi:purine nucleosidase
MASKRQLLLDVDVGIDDAIMILMLAAEPGAEIVAVGSCHGNCPAATAATNALKVLEAVGLDDVPVALGAESPLATPHAAPEIHGRDGLGEADLPPPRGRVSGESATAQMLRLSRERPGELDLIAVGAMTNLALALAEDPQVLSRFRTVAILGGLAREPRPGDPPLFDANVYSSPEAADALLASEAPLLVVPIDTSREAVLDEEHIARLRASQTPQGRLAWQILPFYFHAYVERLGRWSARMHDPLTAAVLLDPSLIQVTVERPMYVEPVDGEWRAVGREGTELAGRPARPAARIVTAVDQRRFLDRLVDALTLPLGRLAPIGDGCVTRDR